MSNKNGEPVCTDVMKRLIDFTDDDKRCLLLKGEWYSFNDDYVQYIQDSIAELEVIYDPKYDFSNPNCSDNILLNDVLCNIKPGTHRQILLL